MSISNLQSWARDHGATLHESVEVHQDDSGCSLKTRADSDGITTKLGTTERLVVSCPLELSLSAFNAFPESPLFKFPKSYNDPIGRAVPSSRHPDEVQPAIRGYDVDSDDFSEVPVNPSSPAVLLPLPTIFPRQFLDRIDFHVIGRFFLCQQYLLSKDSFWYPYISTLPQPDDIGTRVGTPLFWTWDEQKWISGTNLEVSQSERYQEWREEWRNGLRALGTQTWDRYRGFFTFDLYQWAATIFSSRCFVGKLVPFKALVTAENVGEFFHQERMANRNPWVQLTNHERWTRDKSEWLKRVAEEHESSQILFPLVDLANHNPEARVTWRVDDSPKPESTSQISASSCHFKIIAEDDITHGEQVFNNYGSNKYNSELLLGYGFCLPDTRNDILSLDINSKILSRPNIWKNQDCYLPPAQFVGHMGSLSFLSALELIRFSIGSKIRSIAEKADVPQEFRMFQHGLVDCVAIAAANKNELAYIKDHPSLCLEKAPHDGPLARLLLLTISTIEDHLLKEHRKIMKLGPLGNPETRAQRYAKIYLDGQLLIVTEALSALEERLKNAYRSTKYQTIGGKPRLVIPSLTLWTIFEAYEHDVVGQWLAEFKEPKYQAIHDMYKKACGWLELEPHQTLSGPEVLKENWDALLWMLWLCMGSIIIERCQPETLQNDRFFTLQWIANIQTKFPIHTKPAREFVVETKQEFDDVDYQDLKDLLGEVDSNLEEDDIYEMRDRIRWASHVVRDHSFRVKRIFREDSRSRGTMVQLDQLQRVMCLTR